jgi:hypothetical protein
MKIQKLMDILEAIESLDARGKALYVDAAQQSWTSDSRCAILNPEDSKDPGVIDPEFAINNSLKYALRIDDVKSIVRNLKQQIKNPSKSDYIDAINYYMEFDAFKKF